MGLAAAAEDSTAVRGLGWRGERLWALWLHPPPASALRCQPAVVCMQRLAIAQFTISTGGVVNVKCGR